jgi:hypothetical protein
MFDDNHLHESPLFYHVLKYLHYSLNDETLNGKPKQEYFPTYIDQKIILIDIPSRVHYVESPSQFEFLEHAKLQFDHNDSFSYEYFSILECNVSANLESTDLVESKKL